MLRTPSSRRLLSYRTPGCLSASTLPTMPSSTTCCPVRAVPGAGRVKVDDEICCRDQTAFTAMTHSKSGTANGPERRKIRPNPKCSGRSTPSRERHCRCWRCQSSFTKVDSGVSRKSANRARNCRVGKFRRLLVRYLANHKRCIFQRRKGVIRPASALE